MPKMTIPEQHYTDRGVLLRTVCEAYYGSGATIPDDDDDAIARWESVVDAIIRHMRPFFENRDKVTCRAFDERDAARRRIFELESAIEAKSDTPWCPECGPYPNSDAAGVCCTKCGATIGTVPAIRPV